MQRPHDHVEHTVAIQIVDLDVFHLALRIHGSEHVLGPCPRAVSAGVLVPGEFAERVSPDGYDQIQVAVAVQVT